MRDAIKTLEQKQNDWNTAVNTTGRGISADDHQALTQAATAYNTALGKAKESLKRIEGLSGSDIDALKEQVKTFKEKTVPTVNDGTNGSQANEIPDSVDSANAKLADAQKAKEALKQEKDGKTEPYTTDEANAINEKVREFNSALREAREAIGNAKDKIADDLLDSRLTLLGNEAEFVEAKDKNSNKHLDTDDIAEVEKAISALAEKRDAWDNAVRSAGRAINATEKTKLDEAAEAFNTALKKANNALSRVAGLSEEEDLKQRVADFGAEKQPATVNDKLVPQSGTYHTKPGENDIPDSVDIARKALDGAEFSKTTADVMISGANRAAKQNGHDGDYSTYGGLNELSAQAINTSIIEFNEQLRTAKNAIAEAVGKGEINDEERNEFNARLALLGNELPLAPKGYQDDNNNQIQDTIDQANVRNLVAEALTAEADFRAYLRDEVGGAVNQDEYNKLKAFADEYYKKVEDANKVISKPFPDKNEIGDDIKKHLNRLPNKGPVVPGINDTNNNDIPDDKEIRDKVTALQSDEGRNDKGGSFAAQLKYNPYQPDKFDLESKGTGRYMNSIYWQSGANQIGIANGFNLSRSGVGEPIVNVHHNNANRTYLMKVSEHFGYTQEHPGVHSPMSLTTGDKNDALIIGGNASGGQKRAEKIHSIDLGEGNNTMIVGFGNSDLHVGVVTQGKNLGRTVAQVGQEGWGNRSDVQDIEHNGYYTSGYDGYLAGFKSIRMGSGNDAFVVKQDVYRAEINLGNGDNDVFVGGNFYAAELYTGNGNDHLEFTRIGQEATISTGEGNDVLIVSKIQTDGQRAPVVNLGSDNDILILKSEGFIDKTKTKAIQGGEGDDTLILSIDSSHAFQNGGVTSKDIQGFEKIVMKQAALLQISAQDLFDDSQLQSVGGKKVLHIENESNLTAKVNLGVQISYTNGDSIPKELTDVGSHTWSHRAEDQDGKHYDVYSYSHGSSTAEIWMYGNIEVL